VLPDEGWDAFEISTRNFISAPLGDEPKRWQSSLPLQPPRAVELRHCHHPNHSQRSEYRAAALHRTRICGL